MKGKQETILIDQFPNYLRLGAVRSCSLMLSTILPPLTKKNSFKKLGFFIPTGMSRERKVGNAICYVNDRQKKQLRDFFMGNLAWDGTFEKFYLTEELMEAYFKGKYGFFEKQRAKIIKEAEKYIVSTQVDNVIII